ncbi:hypothetical protein HMPREF1860_00436 [Prevotella amnii]|uniref:Uncharacterized protein n=1 Tax=Prevotella amnii TaxID=419005 RepID=A0A134BJL8_9BACT|nr:hypothetical protein HMPREF1860_00436 [Prevotella amnii]
MFLFYQFYIYTKVFLLKAEQGKSNIISSFLHALNKVLINTFGI